MQVGGGEWEDDMRGQRHSGEGLLETRGKGSSFLDQGLCFWVGILWFGVWVYYYRGASIDGSFGLGGQECSLNSRAREPDRLCSQLAGRKDSVLANVSTEQQGGHTKIGEITSDRGMYFHEYVVLFVCYVNLFSCCS